MREPEGSPTRAIVTRFQQSVRDGVAPLAAIRSAMSEVAAAPCSSRLASKIAAALARRARRVER